MYVPVHVLVRVPVFNYKFFSIFIASIKNVDLVHFLARSKNVDAGRGTALTQ